MNLPSPIRFLLAWSIPALLILALHAGRVAAAENPAAADLERGFRSPGDDAKPWAYWWWLKGNVDEKSITRDLEAMKRMGFSGLLLFDARGYHEAHVPPPESRMEFMSPEWRRLVRFALAEANRLGIEVSINLSSCAGALKGPWEVGDDAPKKLLWTSCDVQGPRRLDVGLGRPENAGFRDVAVLAVRRAAPAPAGGKIEAVPADLGGLAKGWKDVQPSAASPAVADVVDITAQVDARGRLAWDVPEGRWTLLRFGYATMQGHEYDVDVLDPDAVAGHFRRMGKALLDDAGPLAGKTLTHFYSVSWEGAIPTWTGGLERDFQGYRGYAMRPYLPVLAGLTVKSPEVSARFLADYHKTLGECFRDHFYGKLHELCRGEGLRWHSESGGPWTRKLATFEDADQLAFLARNDMPQGEFWHAGGPGHAMNRPSAMTAHTYGKRLAATEAFTHMVHHWSAHPAALKPEADSAFCDGVNHFIWHTFSASPAEFGQPGIEYFAGTHINPNVTWSDQAGPFLAYLARCQFLLRQGHFVGDVCCYVGDKPYQHWGRGDRWSPRASLALGKGYTYDLVNTEVLLGRMAVDHGDLVLPDGMRYRLLVVDLEDDAVPLAVLEKIDELAKAGATVVLGARRPDRAPGLRDYPTCDARVRQLADELWGPAGQKVERRPLGGGEVFAGVALDKVLAAKGILPDFAGPWDYIHRRTDAADLYFVAGKSAAECVFRAGDREPELWDPASGEIRDAVDWRATADGRTAVPIRLAEGGSCFVVFRKPARADHLVSITGPEGGLEIAGRDGDGVRLRLWRPGRYVLKSAQGHEQNVEVDAVTPPVDLLGPWQVSFQPGRGAPPSAVFDKLLPWNEHPDAGIKYFSGRATYKIAFDLSEGQAAGFMRLELGAVKNIADVRVNGKPLGIVWTAPWSVDLTGVARPGRNDLEIDVTNLWVNRLIGDAGLPPEKRLTKSNVALQADRGKLRAFEGFSSKDRLLPSGLLGPVRLEFGRQQDVAF